MLQVIEMTDKEKLDMYLKLSKKELAKMLIEANKHLENQQPIYIPYDGGFGKPFWPPYEITCNTTDGRLI